MREQFVFISGVAILFLFYAQVPIEIFCQMLVPILIIVLFEQQNCLLPSFEVEYFAITIFFSFKAEREPIGQTVFRPGTELKYLPVELTPFRAFFKKTVVPIMFVLALPVATLHRVFYFETLSTKSHYSHFLINSVLDSFPFRATYPTHVKWERVPVPFSNFQAKSLGVLFGPQNTHRIEKSFAMSTMTRKAIKIYLKVILIVFFCKGFSLCDYILKSEENLITRGVLFMLRRCLGLMFLLLLLSSYISY